MSLKTRRPQLDVSHRGDSREFGEAMGEALRDKIHGALSTLPRIDSFSVHQPWWMPFSIYRMMAQRKARLALEPGTQRWYPGMAERLLGMASGAGVPLDALYLFHMLEVAPLPLDGRVLAPPGAGCSAVALGNRCCTAREPMIAHNFDLLPVTESYFTLRETAGTGPYRSLQFTFAALGGAVDGVNEAGLGITYNFAAVCDASPSRPPVSFAIDEALAHCGTVPEAVAHITNHPRGGGAVLMLVDAEGRMASLELSGSRHNCRRPRWRQDMLLHTNEFQTRRMRQMEPHRASIYGQKSPRPLRGRPLFRSPIMRRRRLQKLASRRKTISPDQLRLIMSDHGRTGKGTDDTVCMHGDYWSTIASIELLPASRRMRLAYGPPCQASYATFQL